MSSIKLTEIQKEILTKIEPNYLNVDKFDLAEMLQREIESHGLSDGTFNEYGLMIDRIIDVLLFSNERNKLYI